MAAGESTQTPLRTRACVILGLSSLAVAQPLLDLFGRNPEFFVAGSYSRRQIVAFALLVAVVPPAMGIGLTALAGAVNRRAGQVTYLAVLVVFAAAFTLGLLRRIGLDQVVLAVLIAGAVAAAIVLAVVRTRPGTLFGTYLAAANLLFLATFFFVSPTSDLVAAGGDVDVGRVEIAVPKGPVVVIVLDELPAATIMRADGTLNADRYPGFAELASVSTWFRNASSQYNLTHRAVPSLLDGRLAEGDDLPTYRDHPRSLFTLLGQVVPIERYESVTDLCPPSICEPPPQQPLTQALEDASIVYGHRVLPSPLRDELPAIDQSWGAFGVDDAPTDDLVREEEGAAAAAGRSIVAQAYAKWRGLDADEKSPLGQAGVLRAQVAAITADPTFHFVHVALPHRPWVLSADGTSLWDAPDTIKDRSDPRYEFAARMEYQLHAMQVGAADTLVGELVDHLRTLPTWEDTLLVVTSDHGTNLTAPNIGRMKVTADNREEIYRVPLFVKAPGQTTGEIRDDSAQNLDVLPSIIDLLGADTDWAMDGHSLYDASTARLEPKVDADVAGVLDIAARRAETFPSGDDWVGLAAVGEHGDLVGRAVAELDVGDESAYSATLAADGILAGLPTADNELPLVLDGVVTGNGGDEPPELLAAVNGRLAGVVGGFRRVGDGWSFTGYVADLYRDGANTVELYEVEGEGVDVTLHPLG